MSAESKTIDTILGIAVTCVVLYWMGKDQAADERKNAEVMQEAKAHARSQVKDQRREYAALTERAKALTSYDHIKTVRAGQP